MELHQIIFHVTRNGPMLNNQPFKLEYIFQNISIETQKEGQIPLEKDVKHHLRPEP